MSSALMFTLINEKLLDRLACSLSSDLLLSNHRWDMRMKVVFLPDRRKMLLKFGTNVAYETTNKKKS